MRHANLLASALIAAVLVTTGCGRVTPTASLATGSAPKKMANAQTTPSYKGGAPSVTTTSDGGVTLSGVGSLSGHVVDSSNHGIPGAIVQMQPGGQRFTADATGTFRATGISAGNYTFSAMANGFTQAMPIGVLVEANANADVPPIMMVPGSGPSGVTSVIYTQEASFGQEGQAPAPLVGPESIAVRQGDVLVLDLNNMPGVKTGVVRQYNGETGAFAGKYGDYSKWLGLNQMKNTVKAIAVDAQGRALVLDSSKQIWRFKTNGDKDKVISVDVENGSDITVDGTGNIIVAGDNGLTRLNPEGDGPASLGQLSGVKAVAGGKDAIWALIGNKVTQVGADGTAGLEYGPAGAGGGTDAFSDASDIAVDARNGNVVVVDKGAKNVYVYDAVGTLIGKIGQGVFDTPVAATVDLNGRVFVLDQAKKKVYKFAPTSAR